MHHLWYYLMEIELRHSREIFSYGMHYDQWIFDTYLVMVQEHTRVDLKAMCTRAREGPKGTHVIRNEGERKRRSRR